MKKWFFRIAIFSAAVAFASNFAIHTPRGNLFPAAAGAWRLASQAVHQPVPAELRSFRKGEFARKAWRATYAGDPPMTVTVYGMPRYPAVAFDALQQWQPAPGKMAFFGNGSFGIVESPGATQAQMARFVRSLTLNGAPMPGGVLLR